MTQTMQIVMLIIVELDPQMIAMNIYLYKNHKLCYMYICLAFDAFGDCYR